MINAWNKFSWFDGNKSNYLFIYNIALSLSLSGVVYVIRFQINSFASPFLLTTSWWVFFEDQLLYEKLVNWITNAHFKLLWIISCEMVHKIHCHSLTKILFRFNSIHLPALAFIIDYNHSFRLWNLNFQDGNVMYNFLYENIDGLAHSLHSYHFRIR